MGWFKDLTGESSGDLGSFLLNPTIGFYDAQQAAFTGEAYTPGGEYMYGKFQDAGLVDGFGGANDKTHTVTTEPWAAIRPSLMRGISTAEDVYYDDAGNLRQRQYTGPGAVSQSAIDRLSQRSMGGGDPLQTGAEDYLSEVLGGGVNPYLSEMYDTAADKLRSRLDSQFAQAGRYGSDAHEREMGGALGDLATNLYGGQYQSDMDRRMQAAQVAPQIGYHGIDRQLQAGQYLDELERERANWDTDTQMRDLQSYIDQINSIGGTYASQSSPIYRNRTAEALGLLTGGAGLVGQLMKIGGG